MNNVLFLENVFHLKTFITVDIFVVILVHCWTLERQFSAFDRMTKK